MSATRITSSREPRNGMKSGDQVHGARQIRRYGPERHRGGPRHTLVSEKTPQEDGEIREEQEKCFHVTVSTTSSAMSRVLIRSATSLPFTPSSNIVRQKGQAEARTSGFTAMACSTRIWFIRRPSCSSIHTRPPPPPQQKPLLLCRGISTSSRRQTEPSTRRGGSYTSL